MADNKKLHEEQAELKSQLDEMKNRLGLLEDQYSLSKATIKEVQQSVQDAEVKAQKAEERALKAEERALKAEERAVKAEEKAEQAQKTIEDQAVLIQELQLQLSQTREERDLAIAEWNSAKEQLIQLRRKLEANELIRIDLQLQLSQRNWQQAEERAQHERAEFEQRARRNTEQFELQQEESEQITQLDDMIVENPNQEFIQPESLLFCQTININNNKELFKMSSNVCPFYCDHACLVRMYNSGLAGSAFCVFLSMVICFVLIIKHLHHFNLPYFQSKIIIMLMMAPFYGLTSIISLGLDSNCKRR